MQRYSNLSDLHIFMHYYHQTLIVKSSLLIFAKVTTVSNDDNSLIFLQMFCYFEGAMGFHCNREVTKQMTK